jgi:hypothetical protein
MSMVRRTPLLAEEGGSGGAGTSSGAGVATGGASGADGKATAGGAPDTKSASAGPADKKSILGGTDAGAGDKGKAGEPTKDGEPKDKGGKPKLEVKLPEGVQVDKAVLEKFLPLAEEIGLDSEKASKLAAFHAATLKEVADRQAVAVAQQHEAWFSELEQDKEFGGKNLDASAALARKAVVRFGGAELVADLKRLGIDNLPSLARAFAKAGKAIAEDTSQSTSTETKNGAANPTERLLRFYDDMAPRKSA